MTVFADAVLERPTLLSTFSLTHGF